MRRCILKECLCTKERCVEIMVVFIIFVLCSSQKHLQSELLFFLCFSWDDPQKLRRHGDILKRTVGGFLVVQGRADDTMNLGGIKVKKSLQLPPSFTFFQILLLTKEIKIFVHFPFWHQTSSVEIERVCNRADDSILETAAISSAPPNGGPEQLAIFVVLKQGFNLQPDMLKMKFTRAIQQNLNPLFKVESFLSINNLLLLFGCFFFIIIVKWMAVTFN